MKKVYRILIIIAVGLLIVFAGLVIYNKLFCSKLAVVVYKKNVFIGECKEFGSDCNSPFYYKKSQECEELFDRGLG